MLQSSYSWSSQLSRTVARRLKQALQPVHLEEVCPNHNVICKQKILNFLFKRTNNIHKFEGCFLRGQVSSNGFNVFNGRKVEPWILLVRLQKTWESFVFRTRSDWSIFFQVLLSSLSVYNVNWTNDRSSKIVFKNNQRGKCGIQLSLLFSGIITLNGYPISLQI